MKGHQFGSYCIFAVNKDESAEKKLDILKQGVTTLIDQFKEAACIPEMDTMKLIVKEGLITLEDEPDWYADEKDDYVPHDPYWAMTIGMKFTGRE